MRVVQKFGGTSVADAERIRHVAGQVAGRVRDGDEVVVVVSAMGNRTDELIDLALEVSPDPDPRELDQLLATGEHMSAALMAMALHALDQEAVGLTGSQAGIYSCASHGAGRIQRVDADRIEEELRAGRIPIVAGFQGVTEEAACPRTGSPETSRKNEMTVPSTEGLPTRKFAGRYALMGRTMPTEST